MDISMLEGTVKSLEANVASRLTYKTAGHIVVVPAAIFGVLGVLVVRRK
jgi:hypothetical protein